jgi:hypothetical protein
MKQSSTALKGVRMEHPLALAVYNDGAHYNTRVSRGQSDTRRHYRAYLLGLVNAEATKQRREFNMRFKPADIDIAVQDLLEMMERHVAEIVTESSGDAY